MNNKYSHRYFIKHFLLAALSAFIVQTSFAQQSDSNGALNIRLNQIGFYPNAPKTAVVLSGKDSVFYVETTNKKTVFTGTLKKSAMPDFAGSYTLIADFSAF